MTTTAFVLSGGGSLGAVQVGMLQALAERNISPNLLVGTSVGAINAAFVAGHGGDLPALDELVRIWRSARRKEIFPVAPARTVLTLAGRRPSLCAAHGVAGLISRHVTFARLEDAVIPLHVVATDLLTGMEVAMSTGDAASAILASAAIPGVFPPVRRGGHVLVDGGLANHAAVSQAVSLGADRIYVLPTGYGCALTAAPRSALGVIMQSLSLMVHRRLMTDIARYSTDIDLIVLPPLCPLSVSPITFTKASELIRRARADSSAWLDDRAGRRERPEQYLALHRHDEVLPDRPVRRVGG